MGPASVQLERMQITSEQTKSRWEYRRLQNGNHNLGLDMAISKLLVKSARIIVAKIFSMV